MRERREYQSVLDRYKRWLTTLSMDELYKEWGRVCAELKGEKEVKPWEQN